MIRWRYKTLHFELKKDGILGGLFLDEQELERSLCRHGQDGWELVAILDVRDGLVALCKQPFAEGNIAGAEAMAASGRKEEGSIPDAEATPLVQAAIGFRDIAHPGLTPEARPLAVKKAAAPQPEPEEQSTDLFGQSDDEDEAPSDGPRVDTGGDEEGSGLSSIKIE
ncbi:MAG: DUF4177 domain-containing protein [Desulfobulbaceae bacterium]|jgi:hypothetical protein|nr:DUF4177 domain-containing protein [Desulfobulbaceae bacterium]